jgi:hypothetical protein
VVDEADADSGLYPGQQVATMMGGMGRSYDGAYAQYVTVPAGQVIPFETSLPWHVVGAAGDVPDRLRIPDPRPGPQARADAAHPRRHLHGGG